MTELTPTSTSPNDNRVGDDHIQGLAVLGSGLLGGSIALAAQEAGLSQVTLWGRRAESVDEAHSAGIHHATTSLEEAVAETQLIILASPVGAMLEILQAASQEVSLDGKLITDVGSVKLTPRDALRDLVLEQHAYYIGSHPMAGSEQTGVAASRADLFQNAACVMTNDFEHPEHLVRSLADFWSRLGCHCHLTTSEKHDEVMARISHLPHILAAVGAEVGLADVSEGQFAGNGMRDTTRVASGHPNMWTEILLRNRAALTQPIQQSISSLQSVLDMLVTENESQLEQWLTQAKQRRDQLQ